MVKATDENIEIYTLPITSAEYDDNHWKQEKITPQLLNSIYNNFPDKTVRAQYLKDHFWHKTADDGTLNIFGRDNNDNIVRAWLYNKENFDKQWGRKFDISFTNQKSYQDLLFDDSLLYAIGSTVDGKFYKFQGGYYDKNKYLASKTSYDVQQNVNKLAEQKLEAERKQREIEENQRKAKRNAELQEGLQSFTTQLLELYKK